MINISKNGKSYFKYLVFSTALIANFLHRAMEKLDKEQLILSFLLSRQINAENISSTHYGVWFSSITTSTTTSKQFSFLIKFLTSCVRFEPAWVLTAHKSNPPHIPAVVANGLGSIKCTLTFLMIYLKDR